MPSAVLDQAVPVNLEGSLDCFGVPELILLLAQTGKTGALRVCPRGGTEGVVFLLDGAITAVSSESGRPLLAQRLVGVGLVTGAQVAATAAQPTPDGALVPTLRRHATLDDEQVRVVAAELALDCLTEMLDWIQGGFTFHGGTPDPDETGLRLDATVLLADARARAAARSTGVYLDRAQVLAPAFVVRPITLTPGEWQLLALVDGSRTAGEVAALSGRGSAGVGALAELVARGVLGPATPRAPADGLCSGGDQPTAELVSGPRHTYPVRVPNRAGRRAGLLEEHPQSPIVLEADPAIDESLLGRLLAGVRSL